MLAYLPGAMIGWPGQLVTMKGSCVVLDETEWGRLERVIADIESAGNFGAMRFEPHVYERASAFSPARKYADEVARAREANRVSLATARMIIATSWGGFQIMGFNIYSATAAPRVAISTFLSDRSIQVRHFRAFVTSRNIAYTVEELRDETKRRDFARKYNGDVDGYAALIEKRIRSFNV